MRNTAPSRRVAVVVGTRPSIVMAAPLINAFARHGLDFYVLHSGQHYSANMDAMFFEDLGLRPPEYRLEGIETKTTPGQQIGAIIAGVEEVLLRDTPRICIVFGDTNTNLAAAIAARKLGLLLGHVEAGERSGDWESPEEHNRKMIDQIADFAFATNEHSRANLRREGIPEDRIVIVGNPIVDSSLAYGRRALEQSNIAAALGLDGDYALMTLHREENVDIRDRLTNILAGASGFAEAADLPLLLLAHPRTLKRMEEFGFQAWIENLPKMTVRPAVGYIDFMALLQQCRIVLTDSGGVQQEACIHRVPCVTFLRSSPWPVTVEIGANMLAGLEPEGIRETCLAMLARRGDATIQWGAPFGNGDTGERIARFIKELLAAD